MTASQEKIQLRAEISRLRDELEQARVSTEDSHAHATQLAAECRRLVTELRDRSQSERALKAEVRLIRQAEAESSAPASPVPEDHRESEAAGQEELRLMVEELQVLAEELEEANVALRRVNAELDQRVTERTAELATANATLAHANAELNSRVEAEIAAREDVQAQLFQQQKLEALGQLTGGVAHDFNNLLTVVRSGIHLLSRLDDPDRRAKIMHRMDEAVARGADLTGRLLAFGRRQALRPEYVDITGSIDDWRDLLAHALRSDLRLETRVEPGVWPVEVDRSALELALLNLALNARDATPGSGTVTLAARNLPLKAADAAALSLPGDGYVELSVSDTGGGMRPEVLERVFEPFFTTKETGKGTGLGLAQVYGFAKQSGGTARVRSAPGAGTTVAVILPRTRARPPAERARRQFGQEFGEAAGDERSAGTAGRRASILLVEDNDEVAALVSDLLRQLGHSITRASTVTAALGALSDERPVDLVFTDVLLPGGGSGLDLAREVARRRPGLPVVLTTGYGGEMLRDVISTRLPLLQKPYEPEALKAIVESSLS